MLPHMNLSAFTASSKITLLSFDVLFLVSLFLSSPSSPIQTGPSLACHNGRQENPVRHDAQKSTRNQNSPAKS
ncbi:hypothetical protein BDV35DRAFT_1463 [Aspergillus flavus]|uniref:Uncharacterized protein n=1 Tax=Aspergillus flavus TaxID=5059 RepID=A0A5N6HIS6_ASPFL|nr:hypothetical protein BDV35DRAFT_1463 [Aspergillus flavus]